MKNVTNIGLEMSCTQNSMPFYTHIPDNYMINVMSFGDMKAAP
jgi:hypothetical protein